MHTRLAESNYSDKEGGGFFSLPSSSSSSFPSTILSALCQINPLNFPKDLRLFPFFFLRVQPLSAPPTPHPSLPLPKPSHKALFFFRYCMAPGRGDCLPNETAVKNSQRLDAPSPLFVLPDPPSPLPLSHSLTPSFLTHSTPLTEKGLICSRWDPHRC